MIKNNIGAIALIVIICVLGCIGYNLTNKPTTDNDALIKALNDTLKTYRDKDSLHHAAISVIEADRKELLKIVNSKDEQIYDLLRNPKVNTVTKIKIETKFDSILVSDSTEKDWNVFYFDNYWISADIRTKADTLQLKNLTVKNESLVSHEEVNNTSVIHIKQLNPYSSTTYIKDYVVTHPKQKNRWLKNLLIGIGVGVTVGVLAH